MRPFPTWTPFENEPDEILGHDNFIQARDMWVDKLAVMVNLSGKVAILFLRRLQDHLSCHEHPAALVAHRRPPHLGTVCEIMPCQVDFAERTLPDEFADGVIADVSEFLGGELSGQPVKRSRGGNDDQSAHSSNSKYELASWTKGSSVYEFAMALGARSPKTTYLCLMLLKLCFGLVGLHALW